MLIKLPIYLMYLIFLYSSVALTKEIKVLSVHEPPANYLNEKGEAEGYVVDIVNALLNEVGDSTSIQFVPEGRGLRILSEQSNSVLFSISRTPYRENEYRWIGQVLTKKWEVYALKESNLVISSLDELKELPLIGLVRGDVREEWLINKKFTNLHSVTHHQQNVKRLFMKRVSAIVYEKPGLIQLSDAINTDESLVESIFTINEAPVYVVMSKQSTQKSYNKWKAAYKALTDNRQLEVVSLKWQAKLKAEFNIDSQIINQLLVF